MSTTRAAPDLIEREAELDRLEAAVQRSSAGAGSFVVVEGQAGIGKSRLLGAGRHLAAQYGLRPLLARGGELERDFAFGVVRQLFERPIVSADADEREQLLSGAAELAAPALDLGPRGGPATGGDVSFAVVHGLYWLVSNLAERHGPLLLEVDDAHWADPPSLRFLAYLVARLEGLPVLTLVAARPGEPATDSRLLAQLCTDPAAETLRPRALSAVGASRVLEQSLGAAPSASFAEACHAASGGNPFLLTELLTVLAADGVEPIDANAPRVRALGPETVSRSLLLRFARLPEASTELARAVAVLGAEADLGEAAAVAGVSDADAGRAADALVSTHILNEGRPLAFVQPVVREAIYADLPASGRAALHARAAAVLRDAGASASRLAPHLLAIPPAEDPEVVEALRAAARAALEQGAADVAQRQLRRALAEPPAQAVLGDVLEELGIAENLAGEDLPASVEHLREALRRAEDPVVRADRAVALCRAVFFTGAAVESYDELEAELDRLTDADPDTRLRVEAELGSIGLIHPDLSPRARPRVSAYEPRVPTTPAEQLQLTNLAALAWKERDAATSAELARDALGDGRLHEAAGGDSIPVYQAAWVMSSADHHEEAEATLAGMLADARERGSTFGLCASHGIRAVVAYRRGDLRTCEVEARSTLGLPIAPVARPLIFQSLILALTERGEFEEAEWAAQESGCGPYLPELIQMNPAFFARGRLRLAQGRPQEALEDFRELGARNERVGDRNPVVSWRVGVVEAALALGDETQAREVAEEHMEDARRWGTPSVVGVALRAQGLAARRDGIPLLREAVQTLVDSPARLEHARAVIDLGSALRRAGKRVEAREALRDGLELARRCGATLLTERAHEELVTAGARPRRLQFSGADSLTASERRVADLAADGQSNREIAQALFITSKTVENHLGRVYGKLEIGSRDQLAEALAADAD